MSPNEHPWSGQPCPFCGSADCVLERTETAAWHGHCRNCSASGPASVDSSRAPESWDRRAPAGKARRAAG